MQDAYHAAVKPLRAGRAGRVPGSEEFRGLATRDKILVRVENLDGRRPQPVRCADQRVKRMSGAWAARRSGAGLLGRRSRGVSGRERMTESLLECPGPAERRSKEVLP